MAIYKDIYYADSSDNLSVADISYAEAVSIGDRLESIKLDTAVAVADEAARDALYPAPTQGDAVWRNDLKIEQRYYELSSASNLGGKSIAGWYAATSSYSVVIPTSVDVTGTGATASINEVGDITFTNALSITINDVFQETSFGGSYYDRYKFLIDITSINPITTTPRVQYSVGGVALTSGYYWASNGFWNTGVHGFVSGSTSSYPVLHGPSSNPTCYTELNIGRRIGYPATLGGFYMFRGNATMSASSTFNQVYNVSGHVFFPDPPDGIKIITTSGTSTMSGTIKVYGNR